MINPYILLCLLLSLEWTDLTGSVSGDKLYNKGEYEAAKVKYLEALRKKPGDAGILHNLGLACYRMKDFNNAVFYLKESLERAESPKDVARINYNLGVVFSKNDRLYEASEAFKQSLLLNSNHQEARENLQMVLDRMRKGDLANTENRNSKKPGFEYPDTKSDKFSGQTSLSKGQIFDQVQKENRQKRIEIHNARQGRRDKKVSEW